MLKMTCLLIVDLQNDFLPTGSLPTIDGDKIIGEINSIQSNYDFCAITRDWHPSNHKSFKSVTGLCQDATKDSIQWPNHCVQNTNGAEFADGLNIPKNIFSKGENINIEAFSGFENEELVQFVLENNIQQIDIVGLALEFCVKQTAIDATKFVQKVRVLSKLTGSVFENSLTEIKRQLEEYGIDVI